MAAAFLGINLSSFIRLAALERSAEILKGSNTLILSDKDRDVFLKALENPPKPNIKLKRAFLAYKKKKKP